MDFGKDHQGESLLELLSLRKECAELRTHLASNTVRLENEAAQALAECQRQRQEILRLQLLNDPSSTTNAGGGGGGPPELVEAFRELERLELALVEERQRSAQLLEDKQAAEASHARDVAMLEKMLQQVLSENDRLSGQLTAWEASKMEGDKVESSDGDSTPKAATKHTLGIGNGEMDEPEMEPRRCVALAHM